MSEALMSEGPEGSGEPRYYGPERERFTERLQDPDKSYLEGSRDYP